MKTKNVTAALAFLFLTITAFGFDKTKSSAKDVAIEGAYQKITVGANIKLVLIPANQKMVTIAGDPNGINDVSVKIDRNEMIISSKKGPGAGRVVVYVPAADLSYIDLKRRASVSGEGNLKFSNLTVFVNVDSRMELKMIGNINIKHGDDCDFIYEKKVTGRVVYVK